jgi:hypothetical protein
MCALCGVLGGADHWTDAIARPGIFTPNTDAARVGARDCTASRRPTAS